MTFDDIKKTLIQAITTASTIEVQGGQGSRVIADSYAFGIPTAFSAGRDLITIRFRNGGASNFAIDGVTEITVKHAHEWLEQP